MVTDNNFDESMLGSEAERERSVRANFWSTLRRLGRNVPFAQDAVAAYYCALDPASPRRVRLTLLGALAYFVLPADVVPDFLPFIGFGDDLTVLMSAIGLVTSHITPEHREAARRAVEAE